MLNSNLIVSLFGTGTQVALGGLLFLFLGGCSADASMDRPIESGPPGDGDSTIDGAEIEFSPAETLKLTPGAKATVEVLVTPPQGQEVTFEILSEAPDFDGYLLSSTSKVASDGVASVEVEAPSQPGSFEIRASLSESQVATRAISVSSLGYGTVNVSSVYDGGRRIEKWTTSIRPDVTCDELESYFQQGTRVFKGHDGLTIEDVPSGVPIAVMVRGDELVSGCTTIANLIAESEEEVTVELNDRPLDLSATQLWISLAVESTTTEFADHFQSAIATGLGIFRGEDETDAQALLRAMGEQLSDSHRAEFNRTIEAFNFSQIIQSRWEDNEVISAVLTSSMSEATESMSGEGTFVGSLTFAEFESTFSPETAAGVPANAGGFLEASSWKVTVESGDTLVMGGDISYQPLRWITAIVNAQGDTSLSEHLANDAQCESLAMDLFAASASPTHADCEEICLNDLCGKALGRIWEDISAQEAEETSTLQIAISGRAELIGPARVDAFEGTWVGRLNEDDSSIKGATIGDVR